MLLLLLSACGTDTLSQSWQLDRLRVLGARAIPAEPQPGEQTTFESLVYVPSGTELEGVLWFACLPESATDFGCTLDESLLDSGEPDIEALYEAGFIGYEPYFSPSWLAPEDALDGLDEVAAKEGVSALVNITAMPVGAEDDADFELAYKRVPVSLADTPNHNPEITGLLIDGELWDGGLLVSTAGAVHTLEPVLADDAIEEYQYTADDGTTETRTEEPYFTWYTEAGTFDQSFSLYPFSSIEWAAPALSSGEQTTALLLVVMRDRRGGMAWADLTIQISGE